MVEGPEIPKAGGAAAKAPLLQFLSPRTFGRGRLRLVATVLGLVALVMPWAAFSVDPPADILGRDPPPYPGASGLPTVASGLTVVGATANAPVAGNLVVLVGLLVLVGALITYWHPLGGLLPLFAAGLYAAGVNGPLAALGAAHVPPVSLSPGIGFWFAVLSGVFALVPLTPSSLRERLPFAPKRAHQAAAMAGLQPPAVTALAAPLPQGPVPDLLTLRNLTVRFYTYDGVLKALDGVAFSVRPGEILGIVGETGCGKSVTAKAIMRLIPDPPGRITGGEVVFQGVNLLDSIEEEARIKVNSRGRARIRRNRRIAKRMEAVMRTVRGKHISMIFQEPTAALNPVVTIGEQIGETFITHQLGEICRQVEATRELSVFQRRFFARLKEREEVAADLEGDFRGLSVKRAILKAAREAGDLPTETAVRDEVQALEQAVFRRSIRLGVLERRIAFSRRIPFLGKDHLMAPVQVEVDRRVVEMLKQVNIPDPERKAQSFPFELSGGMQQRAMIAMALACRPRLLLADEPTTALDVTIQAQILSLIRGLRDQFGSSIILITHDLGVVAETCERVGVMYAGVMAEIGQASDIFNRPRHPYTVGLMRSIPETFVRTGKLSIIPGSVPSLLTPPPGCRFHPRCPFAADICKEVIPVLAEPQPGHQVACHLYDHPEAFPPSAVALRDKGLDEGWERAVVP